MLIVVHENNKKNYFTLLLKYLKYLSLKNISLSLMTMVILTVVVGLFPISINYINKTILDFLVTSINQPTGNIEFFAVLKLVFVLILLNILNSTISTIIAIKRNTLSEKAKNTVTLSIYNKINKIDYSNFENNDVMNDIYVAQSQTSSPIDIFSLMLSIIQSVVTLLSSVIVVATMNPVIILFAFLTILPGFFYQLYIQKKQYAFNLRMTLGYRRIGYLKKLLLSSPLIRELRLYNANNKVFHLLKSLVNKFTNFQITFNNNNTKGNAILDLLSGVFYWSFFIYLLISVLQKKYTIGEYTLFLSSFSLIQGSLKKIFQAISQLSRNIVYTEKFVSIMELPENSDVSKESVHEFTSKISIRNLSFSYPGASRNALTNISLDIHKGQKIGFVGENGSGKSTLLKLLIGCYMNHEGSIHIDNKDIRTINTSDYQSLFSYVMQDFGSYNFSVRNNLAFFDMKSDSELINATSVSGIHEYISNLKNGYSTILGNEYVKGEGLSGGQWQKIAIARALVKNAPVFIFDEINSTLDSISESKINAELFSIGSDRTVIFTSHTFSDFEKLDMIYVFENGSIIECGNHDELIKKKSKYYDLYLKRTDSSNRGL